VTLTWSEPNRKVGTLEALGLIGLIGLLVGRFVPVARLPFWGCMFREVTGWPCLGCGLTRAADRFAHGNVLGALTANPLGALAAMAFAIAVVWAAAHLIFKLRVPSVHLTPRESSWLKITVGVALVFNWAFVAAMHRNPQWLSSLWG
jgi:hypothetical protein